MKENSREYQKAVDYICSEIANGNISIGDRLPTERTLSGQLGISRNSTREALRSLENMGITESVRGSGNYYTGNVSKKDICDFRRTMELSVCMTIMNKSDFDFTEIESVLNKETISTDDEVDKDKMFHYLLAMSSGNVFWMAIMDAVIDVYRGWIDEVIKIIGIDTKEKLDTAHKNILSSLISKDKEKCENAINLHYDIIDDVLNS